MMHIYSIRLRPANRL